MRNGTATGQAVEVDTLEPQRQPPPTPQGTGSAFRTLPTSLYGRALDSRRDRRKVVPDGIPNSFQVQGQPVRGLVVFPESIDAIGQVDHERLPHCALARVACEGEVLINAVQPTPTHRPLGEQQ